ncbi:MAG: DUF4054 domain-containing protein [Spirochaetaceae bacterium]|nr:DUF4054 domain-containing protein [Spirochaetaceae bacterium]
MADPRRIIAAVCPELAASPSLDDFLDMAAELTDREFFGKLASYAVAYRACHLFMVSGGGGSGSPAFGMGQIASMSEGGLSVSFAAGASKSGGSGLDTTKYGKLLLDLIKSRPTMGVNTAGLHFPVHGGY